MNRAARRGKSFHKLVEQYLNNETPSIRDVLPLGLFRLAKPYIDQINNIRLLEKSRHLAQTIIITNAATEWIYMSAITLGKQTFS